MVLADLGMHGAGVDRPRPRRLGRCGVEADMQMVVRLGHAVSASWPEIYTLAGYLGNYPLGV